MAWRQPKRNGKNNACGHRGQCSCQRRINAAIAQKPELAPRSCAVRLGNGKVCGQTVRGNVCPSPWH